MSYNVEMIDSFNNYEFGNNTYTSNFNEDINNSDKLVLKNYLKEFIRQFQLNILNNYNLINPKEIIKFVLDNDDLIDLFQKINPLIKEYFPNHIYCLEFVPDPEFSNLNQLVCYIKVDDAVFYEEWKILKQLNKDIRHSIGSNSKSLFSVDLW